MLNQSPCLISLTYYLKDNTHNIGTTKPLEIALPADQQARRKYITNTEHRDLRKEGRKLNLY